MLAKLNDCHEELKGIKARIDKDQFDEMVRFLQRYAIIKACGTIEYVVKNMIADRVSASCSPELQNYISVKVRDSSTNPSTGNISTLLGEFSTSDWKKDFDAKLSSHLEEKASLNSLVQLRNDFAHGKSPAIGINSIIKYFEHARVIVELVDETIT